MIRRRRLVAAISALAFLVSAPCAQAQRLTPVAVTTHRTVPSPLAPRDTATSEDLVRGAVVGTGVGLIVSLAAVLLLGGASHTQDSSGTGLAVLMAGAVTGLFVGISIAGTGSP